MLARENPHCGISGVPFMNRTTGADATALSIAARVSEDSNLIWRDGSREGRRAVYVAVMGRDVFEAWRKAWTVMSY